MSTVLSRIGMKSMIRTAPSAVSNSVSSTSVWSRRRRGAPTGGGRDQPPAVVLVTENRREARPAVEAGAHNQSIEPSSPISAAVWVSPTMAYCSMCDDTDE